MENKERKVEIINRRLGEFPKLLNVAVYCRVSTSHKLQLESLARQVSYYKDMVNNNHQWTLIEIYIDERSSKNVSRRNEFVRMISDSLNGKIDLIITKSVSRFGRNTVEILENIYKLRKHNVNVFFENEK